MALQRDELDQIVRALLPLIRPVTPPAQLGTELQLTVTLFTFASTADIIAAKRNPNRVWLSLSNQSTVPVFVVPEQATRSLLGYILIQSVPPLIFSTQNDGLMPQLEWHASLSAAGSNLMVIEQVYTPK